MADSVARVIASKALNKPYVNYDELTPEQQAQAKGPKGDGVPSGGTAGQILAKKTNIENDTEWV